MLLYLKAPLAPEVNDKAIYSTVNKGLTVPRGVSTAYAVTTPTARFPLFDFVSSLGSLWLLFYRPYYNQ
ncbi:hypothetical protein CS536_01765 [Yersinia kristensenii]|nr:hypothetical protein CS536_01765 [Yersinia kristensenii]PJE85438.1 hypothetical protein CU276_03785 [Yersinia kristensenii]